MPTSEVSAAAGTKNGGTHVFALLLLLLFSHPALAINLVCSNPVIQVSAQSNEVHAEVCAAAGLAIDFLSAYGLELKHPIRIEIIEQPLSHRGYSAYGTYNSIDDLVQVMSPQIIHELTASPRMLYQPIDATQYAGIVAHEVAHAMIEQNSKISPLPIGQSAQEYLATVTQLSILPDEVRRQITDSANVAPWESGDVISAVYMAIAPERFAVKCYLHFQQHAAPETFVEQLLGSKLFYVQVE